MQARRRKRWLVYAAAIAAASVLFVGALYFLGRADLIVPATVVSLIPFPALWVAIHATDEWFRWAAGRIVPFAYMEVIIFSSALVYVFVYLFIVCLPSFYRRKVLGVPWWLLQILVLLPGIVCGICYWGFYY